MDLKFSVFACVSRSVHEVFEAVADPARLSCYFTTGGAEGRMEEGVTVTWDFHDFPGAFPVKVREAVQDERIVFEWEANEEGAGPTYNTVVTMTFQPVDGEPGRTRVEIAEEGWRETEAGLAASYGNCMGWSQMLAALKAWVEHGINLREGMYR